MSRPFLTAEWRHLAMLNFAIDPEVPRPRVPAGTELDSWRGETLVSLVGFHFLNTRLRGVPIPFHRDFNEVNLRFYVRREEAGELRRGVVSIREVVPLAPCAADRETEAPVTHGVTPAAGTRSMSRSRENLAR